MRENRPSGSEGGGDETNRLFPPLSIEAAPVVAASVNLHETSSWHHFRQVLRLSVIFRGVVK